MKLRIKKIPITIIFNLLPLFLGDCARLLTKFDLGVFPHLSWLPTLRIAFIIYSIICLIYPWLLQKQLVRWRKTNRLVSSPGAGILVLTYEAVWNTGQAYLNDIEKINMLSPRGVVRESFKIGLMDEEKARKLMDRVDDRKRTVHTYTEDVAQAIFGRLAGHKMSWKTG